MLKILNKIPQNIKGIVDIKNYAVYVLAQKATANQKQIIRAFAEWLEKSAKLFSSPSQVTAAETVREYTCQLQLIKFCQENEAAFQIMCRAIAERKMLVTLDPEATGSYCTKDNKIVVAPGMNHLFTNNEALAKACEYMNWQDFTQEDDAMQIALYIIGKSLTVHEALHGLYTDISRMADTAMQLPQLHAQVYKNIQNIIEDCFIEHIVSVDGFERYGEQLLFLRSACAFSIKNQELPEALDTNQKLAAFMNYFMQKLLFPMGEIVSHKDIEKEIQAASPIFEYASRCRNQQDRIVNLPLKIIGIIHEWLDELQQDFNKRQDVLKQLMKQMQDMMAETNPSHCPTGQNNSNSQVKGDSLDSAFKPNSQADSNGADNNSQEEKNPESQKLSAGSKDDKKEQDNNSGSDNSQEEKKSSSQPADDNQSQKGNEDGETHNRVEKLKNIQEEIRKSLAQNKQVMAAACRKQQEQSIETCDQPVKNKKAYDIGIPYNKGITLVHSQKPMNTNYKAVMNKYNSIITNYANRLRQNIICMTETDVDRKPMGYKIDSSRLVFKDRRWIAKGTEYDMPPFSITIMVDESGSMYEDMDKVKNICIILTEIFQRNDIPIAVCGHATNSNVDITIFKNFDDAKSKYNIPNMKASGGTINGIPLAWTGMYSDKYAPKDGKNFIIFISDGDSEDIEFCRETYNRMEKEGKNMMFLAINGAYQDLTKSFPKKAIIDCNDISKIPNMIMKYITKIITK